MFLRNIPQVSLGCVESFETLPIFTIEWSLGKRNYREAERLISRVKLLHDPKKIARKRFMSFLCSLRSIVKHTKSRHHSDHQKVFKSDF